MICTPVFRLVMIALVVLGGWAPLQAKTFKIAVQAPDGSKWVRMMKAGTDEISRKTNKRVHFKWYPGGVMGNDKAVFRKIRLGQLQGAAISSGKLSQFFPDSQVYSLPLKFQSFEEVDYVRKHMDPVIQEGIEKGGLVTFGFAEGGFAFLMSNSPVSSVGDLQQQKIWIPADNKFSLVALQSFDVTPIPLALPDVLVGLQSNLVNTVATSPIATLALQWHTQVQYITDIPLLYFYVTFGLDRKAFRKISAEDQVVVREVMGKVYRELDQHFRKDNTSAYNALQKQNIKVVQPAGDMRQAWYNRADNATQALLKSGEVSQDIYQRFEQHLKEFRKK